MMTAWRTLQQRSADVANSPSEGLQLATAQPPFPQLQKPPQPANQLHSCVQALCHRMGTGRSCADSDGCHCGSRQPRHQACKAKRTMVRRVARPNRYCHSRKSLLRNIEKEAFAMQRLCLTIADFGMCRRRAVCVVSNTALNLRLLKISLAALNAHFSPHDTKR